MVDSDAVLDGEADVVDSLVDWSDTVEDGGSSMFEAGGGARVDTRRMVPVGSSAWDCKKTLHVKTLKQKKIKSPLFFF